MTAMPDAGPPWPRFLWDEPLEHGESQSLETITRNLARAIPWRTDTGPVTVAIYGPWGSGKTTILKHLKHELEDPAQATRPRAVTVWFEPWRYETEPNLMVPLLMELTAGVFSSADNISAKAKEAIVKTSAQLFGRLAKAGLRTAASFLGNYIGVKGEDIAALGEDFMKHYEDGADRFSYPESEARAFRRDFESLIAMASTGRKNGKLSDSDAKPLCVFIDDLDRCSSEQVRKLLESMKNFLWTPGVTYVLALDREQVTTAIAKPYIEVFKDYGRDSLLLARERASAYLEKFFLYAFDIGDGAERISTGIVEPERDELWKQLKEQFDKVEGVPWEELELIYQSVSPNLRRLKRAVRWLYYELSLDPKRESLLPFFAEMAFADNFPIAWLDAFEGRSPIYRSTYYDHFCAVLGIFQEPGKELALQSAPSAVPKVIDALRGAEIDDELKPLTDSLSVLSSGQSGPFVAALLEGGDERELRRVHTLAQTARRVGRADRL